MKAFYIFTELSLIWAEGLHPKSLQNFDAMDISHYPLRPMVKSFDYLKSIITFFTLCYFCSSTLRARPTSRSPNSALTLISMQDCSVVVGPMEQGQEHD